MRRAQADWDLTDIRFVLAVGRPYGVGTKATQDHRFRVKVRDTVCDHLTERGIGFRTALKAAEHAVADKLAEPETVETVYLTHRDLAAYVEQAKQRPVAS
jgi:hypothetical protein